MLLGIIGMETSNAKWGRLVHCSEFVIPKMETSGVQQKIHKNLLDKPTLIKKYHKFIFGSIKKHSGIPSPKI